MTNKVSLIILGIDGPANYENRYILTNLDNSIPYYEVGSGDTIEQIRSKLFEDITGFSANPHWIKFNLVDVINQDSMINVVYCTLMVASIPLNTNLHKFQNMDNVVLSEPMNSLVKKACSYIY